MDVPRGLLALLYYMVWFPYYLARVVTGISLHSAAELGDVGLVRLLLWLGMHDVNCTNSLGLTPVHFAAWKSHAEVVLCLIELGCDLNISGWKGRSTLHYACEGGNVSLVRTLIDKYEADRNAVDIEGEAPIHAAAWSGHTDVVNCLIKEFSCNPGAKGSGGRTVLHEACQSGNFSLVQTLAGRCDVDINAKDDKNRSPLYIAIASNNFKVASYLIEKLHCNCIVYDVNGNESKAQSLVYLFANELLPSVKKRDASILSVDSGDHAHKVLRSIIKPWRDDGISRAKLGRYLLHKACEINDVQLVKSLISHQPMDTLLLADDKGNTALHIASRHDNYDCVKALLDTGVLILPNDSGLTPIDIANGEVKQLLLDYKASHIEILNKHDAYFEHVRKQYPGKYSVTRVFVIGNSAAGKSSLIQSLKRSFNIAAWKSCLIKFLRRGFNIAAGKSSFIKRCFNYPTESSAPSHTAGIVPSVHMDQKYGRVCFYDFAGDPVYYSSHAAILERLAPLSFGHDLFIVVVDLTDDNIEIKNILNYWVSFIQHQKFSGMRLSLVVIGSHADLITKKHANLIAEKMLAEKQKYLEKLCEVFKSYLAINHDQVACFTLDCRDPGQFCDLMEKILFWKGHSPAYPLYSDLSLLIGVLEMDFSKYTACPMQDIQSHIKDNNILLPTQKDTFLPIINALHVAGYLMILNLNSEADDYHVVLDCSKLTNELHESLFSTKDETRSKIAPYTVGIIPDTIIKSILPSGITEDCLVQLQFCQKISSKDIPCFPPYSASEENFLFFPALCTADKHSMSTPLIGEAFSYSLSWLALCPEDSRDYFPPRFMHVLLLRLVFSNGFTASDPVENSPKSTDEQRSFQRRCTMWKTGVSWLMTQGVQSTVELVKGNKGVVVICRSAEGCSGDCATIFSKIVNCVMEVQSEFCHSIRPGFYRLYSVDEADYLNKDLLFAESDLQSDSNVHPYILSITGKTTVKREKLLGTHKFTHWHRLFPLDCTTIMDYLKNVTKELSYLALNLGLHIPYEQIDEDNPNNTSKKRLKLVNTWMNTPVTPPSRWRPPCWWRLAQAVDKTYSKKLAKEIKDNHSKYT